MKENKGWKYGFLRIFAIIIIIFVGIFSCIHTINKINSIINYTHNTTVWKEYNHIGVISDQSDFENLKYGFGNISANGCGAISVYNIMVLENRAIPLPDVIKQFDLNGENLLGFAGTKPTKIIDFLRMYGFNVNYSLVKSQFKSIAEKSKYSIYIYVGNYNGQIFGHYQLMYNFDGEKFDTLNTTGHYSFSQITSVPHTLFSMIIGVN